MSSNDSDGCGCIVLIILFIIFASMCSRMKTMERKIYNLEQKEIIQDTVSETTLDSTKSNYFYIYR